jgi:hypothetical protein
MAALASVMTLLPYCLDRVRARALKLPHLHAGQAGVVLKVVVKLGKRPTAPKVVEIHAGASDGSGCVVAESLRGSKAVSRLGSRGRRRVASDDALGELALKMRDERCDLRRATNRLRVSSVEPVGVCLVLLQNHFKPPRRDIVGHEEPR